MAPSLSLISLLIHHFFSHLPFLHCVISNVSSFTISSCISLFLLHQFSFLHSHFCFFWNLCTFVQPLYNPCFPFLQIASFVHLSLLVSPVYLLFEAKIEKAVLRNNIKAIKRTRDRGKRGKCSEGSFYVLFTVVFLRGLPLVLMCVSYNSSFPGSNLMGRKRNLGDF